MSNAKVTLSNGAEFYVKTGETVLSALSSRNIITDAPCGGNGKCGKCKIVAAGALTQPDETETARLTEAELAAGVRLSCRARIVGDCTVTIHERKMTIETGGTLPDMAPSPVSDGLGVAVDVGTTTVAVYLCDLDEGRVLGVEAFKNPQSAYGADVISRTEKISSDKSALTAQQKLLTDAINSAAARLCDKLYKSIKQIRSCVVCGNTIMQHIAAGIDPTPISRAPFTTPTLFENFSVSAKSLGFDFADDAVCRFAPCLASYIGGDISCGIVAAGVDKTEKTTLFLDIGTNGEIALAHGGRIYLCSAAAGPALEGAHIECGTSGTVGAISRVGFDGKLKFETVGGASPRGICGSGLIDAIAVMIKHGVIGESGAFEGDYGDDVSKYVRKKDGKDAFFITEDIYVTGKDVREVQLAKAAVCAGIKILLSEAGIAPTDIDKIVLAGGFGSHLDGDAIKTIGLIPSNCTGEIVFAGNTAGTGAVAYALFGEARERMDALGVNSVYVELSANDDFMEEFMEQMTFCSDEY